MKARWELSQRLVGRQAVAAAVVLATTFGGLGAERASARAVPARAAAVADRLPASIDPVEAVFAFGDDLDAVNYEIGFDPDARDHARLAAACQGVFNHQPAFAAAVRGSDGKAKDIGEGLIASSEATVELCFDPLSADEDAEARAAEGYAEFHEHAFDFADARK